MILNWFLGNSKNREIKEEIRSYVVDDSVNFSALKEINSDTVAYLKINDNINYTVVRGDNNSYYLNHNYYKEYNKAGWIFMDYHNKLDGTDKNIIIYGHNMLDGSMFGSLVNYLKEDFIKDDSNLNFKLISESETVNYRVFSVYQIEPEDYYIKTDFSDGSFGEFINNLKLRSMYDFNIDVLESDSLLTLSTCSFDGSKRMVLHAKRII